MYNASPVPHIWLIKKKTTKKTPNQPTNKKHKTNPQSKPHTKLNNDKKPLLVSLHLKTSKYE